MIKTTKRLVAILLVVVMAMSSFPMVAFAATEYVEGNYTYTVSDSKATIVSYPETAEGVVNIPKTLGGYPVTAIGAYAFYGCTLITEISIPASITSIGNKAFDYCIYLEVVNYGGTEAQWKKISIGTGNECLTDAKIRFKDSKYYIVGREFDTNIDYYTTNWNSSSYNAHLSNMLAALSAAVYKETDIKDAYNSLGFSDCTLYDYDGNFNPNRCGYSMAFKKSDYNEEYICLISVRGSSNVSDWVGNFELATIEDGKHIGFAYPANSIYNNIQNWLQTNKITDTVKYVITGHSRGAAVANLLAVKLMENGVDCANVYDYNYACPDVACKWKLHSYNNIFNLCNREDPVPFVPGNIASALTLPGTSWDKFGQTYWFTSDKDDTINPFADHDIWLYLEHFDKKLNPSDWGYSFWDKVDDVADWTSGWVTKVLCPVDVVITDETGKQIASVIGGKVNYYESSFGDVIILTDGDKKVIYISGDNNYNVELIGTDTGTMTFSIEKVNLASGEIYECQIFKDVVLEDGKKMYSPVSEANIADDVQLFVFVERDGEKMYTHIINEDGTEAKYYNSLIPSPSRTEIRNKDGIILHMKMEDAPEDSYVVWSSNNRNFDTDDLGDGKLEIIAKNKGWTTFTATLYDADGKIIGKDTVEMYSKSGLFDKIGGFFRSLFGTTKIYDK